MRQLLIIILSLAGLPATYSQDFAFGKVTKEEFTNTAIDPDADAITLKEYGLASIELQEIKGGLVLNYYYHTKILILKKDGFDEGNFSVRLHKGRPNEREFIEGIKGATYNLTGGKISETALEKKNILTEKVSETIEVVKIPMPNVQEGSIIELKYRTVSPFLYNFQPWQFQSFNPKIYSAFETEIPEICTYNVNLRGARGLTSRSALPYDPKIMTSTGSLRGTKTSYVMENIPGFKVEDYITAPQNFMSILTFELARYAVPFGPSHDFTTSWKDVEKQLYDDESFGAEVRRKNVFKDILPTIVKAEMTDLEKATAIYDYVRTNIKWNKGYGIFAKKGIKKALEERNGSIADINLALVNALSSADMEASPVILSTRSNGYPSFTHPVMSDFNYVIAHVKIDSTTYLLDASEEFTPFGLIPLRCINMRGRLVNPKGSAWIPLEARSTNLISYSFDGSLDDNGDLRGDLVIYRDGYNALNKRNSIREFNSIEEYLEKEEEKYPQFRIVSSKVENYETIDQMMTERFEIAHEGFAHKAGNTLNLNPILVGKTNKNPFNLDERNYPVDLGSTVDESYDIRIKIPDGYKLIDQPKGLSLALPNRDARYLYAVTQSEDNALSIKIRTSINKPLFLPDQYLDLKEFFSRIIQSQKIDIKISKEI